MTAPSNLPPPPDAADWEKAAGEFYRGSLDRLQGSAEKWAGTVATLLGLFGTVAIVTGPTEIAKISSPDIRNAAVILTIVAGVAAGAAMITGALAAQGSARLRTPWGGEDYRAYVTDESRKARILLLFSRGTGIAAAAAVFAAGVLVLAGANGAVGAEQPKQYVSVVMRTGEVICGEFATVGGRVTVDGRVISGAVQLVPVEGC